MRDEDPAAGAAGRADGDASATPPAVNVAVGLLAAVTVWSPLMGSALWIAFIAGACALGMLWVSRSAPNLAVGASVPLVITAIVFVGLFACSIWAATTGATWAGWVAAGTAGLAVAGGLFVVERRRLASSAAG